MAKVSVAKRILMRPLEKRISTISWGEEGGREGGMMRLCSFDLPSYLSSFPLFLVINVSYLEQRQEPSVMHANTALAQIQDADDLQRRKERREGG